jgi:hypothetical protein
MNVYGRHLMINCVGVGNNPVVSEDEFVLYLADRVFTAQENRRLKGVEVVALLKMSIAEFENGKRFNAVKSSTLKGVGHEQA